MLHIAGGVVLGLVLFSLLPGLLAELPRLLADIGKSLLLFAAVIAGLAVIAGAAALLQHFHREPALIIIAGFFLAPPIGFLVWLWRLPVTGPVTRWGRAVVSLPFAGFVGLFGSGIISSLITGRPF